MSSLPIIMMVAEKPSICNSIAIALSGGLEFCNSHGKTPPVHEFTGTFQNKKVMYRVTSVTGHVFSTDFPKEYQDWEATAPADLFSAPVLSIPTRGSIVSLLKNEGRGIDSLILWLDCDREGENICFEVIRCVKSVMLQRNGQQIYRAKFSAVNREDIVKAMKTLGVPNKAESDAVDARQELDLKVGVAFSRFQTLFFSNRYADLDARCISYGPCQSPTLGFCVRRHIEMLHFQPEPYWSLQINIMNSSNNNNSNSNSSNRNNTNHTKPISLDWHRERCFDEAVCKTLYNHVCKGMCLTVLEVKTNQVKQSRPTPMNTVALLKVASKALGIGPHDTMRAAENLYLRGYLSYPRTESTAYPKSYDIQNNLSNLTQHEEWGYYVVQILNNGYTKPKGGVDMGDHPPITPCRLAQSYELSGNENRIYDLVTRHFIASVSPDAIYRKTQINFDGNNELFSLSAKILIDPGFLEIQRFRSKKFNEEFSELKKGNNENEENSEKKLPIFQKGEKIEIIGTGYDGNNSENTTEQKDMDMDSFEPRRCSISMKSFLTKSPDYLTESELIGLMERNGIGTDASIPTHINNIGKRNYVSLSKSNGRRLIPTRLGIVLVQGYLRIDPDLILPRIRATIEDQCNLIANGVATKEDVVEHSLKHFLLKFQYFCSRITRMDDLFSSSFSSLKDRDASTLRFTRCGLTRQYLQYIKGPPPRLYHNETEQVYSLPSGGTIRQFSGRLCDRVDCNFELCLYVVGNPSRCYPLCPNCYNHPDWSLHSTNGSLDDIVEESQKKDKVDTDIDKDTNKNIETKKQSSAAAALSALQRKCLECPLIDAHPTVQSMKVCDDPESGGCFILDPTGGPKWRLISTRSSFSIHFPKKRIRNIKILDKIEHGCHWIKLYFHQDASPLKDGSLTYSGCLLTDTFLHQFLYGQDGSNVKKGGNGRGRGRGRGGRSDRGRSDRGGGRGGKGKGRDREERGGGRNRRNDTPAPTTSVSISIGGGAKQVLVRDM